MIIKELYKPIINKSFIKMVREGKIKIKDGCILWFNTSTAWLHGVLVQGREGDDLMELIDWIYCKDTDNEMIRLYSILDIKADDMLEYIQDYYIGVNGGEYYTDMIEYVEYI